MSTRQRMNLIQQHLAKHIIAMYADFAPLVAALRISTQLRI